MSIMNWTSGVAAAALLSLTPAYAAMAPSGAPLTQRSLIQHVDCAVGFHIGPAGACVIGTEEPEHRVIEEHRATDEGCRTKSVKRTDSEGNTETHTRTNCD